jgi:8-amino-7-oxononanoate synthase
MSWAVWEEETIEFLKKSKLLRSLNPLFVEDEDMIDMIDDTNDSNDTNDTNHNDNSLFDPIHAKVDSETYEKWINNDLDNIVVVVNDDGQKTKPKTKTKNVTLFSSNDYLGLSCNAHVRRAFANAALKIGTGFRASQLIAGYTNWHRSLEQKLAFLERKEGCILFPTGFAANTSVLQTLAESIASQSKINELSDNNNKNDVEIFSDALNHASIVDGCRLAKAKVTIFKHLNYDDLEEKLRESTTRKKIIVTDALFSIDGDVADLKRLAQMKKKYPCLLVVDEAHSTLVFGEFGGGLAEAQGVQKDVDITIGTLSKAVGAHGGFVCCSNAMKSIILSRGRGQIYSTSLPTPIVIAAIQALNVALKNPKLASDLWKNTHYFHNVVLNEHKAIVRTRGGDSHIVPIFCGDERTALSVAKHLLMRGIHAPAIRPPTVPQNQCVIRIAINAMHTSEDLDDLGDALRAAFLKLTSRL